MKDLSILLLPPQSVQAVYQPITDDWAKKLSTPKFEPHITITSAIIQSGEEKSVLKVLEKVCGKLQPIPIELVEVSLSTTYFQCVFARVKPNQPLFEAYQLIKSALRHSDPSMYVPHMSLVYGNLDLNQRFSIATAIKLPVTKFLANRVSVVSADGLNPKTWKQISEFTLI